jgi:uncharacterized protein (DUF1810 family)
MNCSALAWSNARASSWLQAKKPETDILGSPDDMKFRSCMTLFDAVSKQEIFAEAIAAFYPDGKDRATLEILETSPSL